MPKILPYAALVAALVIAGPSLAQSTSSTASKAAPPPTTEAAPQTATPPSATPSTAAPPSEAPSTSAPKSSTAPTGAPTDTAANAGASTVMSGMSVKDNTGALIGEVTAVKGGVATIKMGSDSFSVDTNKLGVANGAATINASQAEIKKMMPKK